MKVSPVFKLIYFDEYSATPKYMQLANCIIKGIEKRKLQVDDVLPSINDLSFEFEISRDTAEKGYKYLKNLGIAESVKGKGYFIKNADIQSKTKIFLLFNKLSAHKKLLYDTLVTCLGDTAAIDFYIYNNDFTLFKNLLLNKKDDYDFYVIIPHFMEGGEKAHEVINTIPKEKLILLDKLVPGVTGYFSAIYENFEKDIYFALEQAVSSLKKYHTLKIVFPENSYFPAEILKGFTRFCEQYFFKHKVVHSLKEETIGPGEAFINLMEDDLVTLIEMIISTDLKVGKDVGVISYNETAIKKIILNGITTISTDFEAMGRETAEVIRDNKPKHLEVPFHLTLRASL